MFGTHAQNGFACTNDRSDHVDAHHALQALPTHFIDPHGDVKHACVVDKASQPTELRVHLGKQVLDLRLVTDISLDADGLPAFGFDLFDDGFSRGGVLAVIDRNGPTLTGCQQGRSGTNASACACD